MIDWKTRFESALTFDQFLATVQKNQDLWHDVYRLATIQPQIIDRVNALRWRRHLLVLVEDWCGDTANIVPPIVRLSELTPRFDVRLLGRDANPDIMDAHLTNVSRSIPVVAVLDEQFVECGWWGPRPRELQRWVIDVGLAMPSVERYRHIRAWYARDHARTTLDELVSLLEQCSATSVAS
ncbi:MAG TPA: thioredoxin family protein [Gemmatimonadaceae bacterium]|nr:thioredoxin family protein [Gemmatimonadaceae bacterium]